MKENYINGIRMLPTEDEEQIWLFFVGEVEIGKVAGTGTDAPYSERREEIEVRSGTV